MQALLRRRDCVAVWLYSPEPNKWLCQAISVHIPSPEGSIFQLEAAGKRLWRKVHDPDDFSGTATNCETEIDFENTNRVPGNC